MYNITAATNEPHPSSKPNQFLSRLDYVIECIKLIILRTPLKTALEEALKSNNLNATRAVLWKANDITAFLAKVYQLKTLSTGTAVQPLLTIATVGNVLIARAFLTSKRDINEVNQAGHSALEVACMIENKDQAAAMASVLIEYGATVNQASINAAINNENMPLAEKLMLIIINGKENNRDFNLDSLFLLAFEKRAIDDLCEWMLRKVNDINFSIETITVVANRRSELAKPMITKKLAHDPACDWMPLYIGAYRNGDFEFCEWMLKNLNLDPFAPIDEKGNTLISDLYLKGRTELFKWVIAEKQVDINKPVGKGYNLIHLAAMNNDIQILPFLLSQKADINAQTPRGETAAMFAVRNAHVTILSELNKAGANLAYIHPKTKMTALQEAAGTTHGEVVLSYLIKVAGQDPNTLPEGALNQLPLSLAIEAKDLDNIRFLIKNRADPRLLSQQDQQTLLSLVGKEKGLMATLKQYGIQEAAQPAPNTTFWELIGWIR